MDMTKETYTCSSATSACVDADQPVEDHPDSDQLDVIALKINTKKNVYVETLTC
jgi:hypothetical protein